MFIQASGIQYTVLYNQITLYLRSHYQRFFKVYWQNQQKKTGFWPLTNTNE